MSQIKDEFKDVFEPVDACPAARGGVDHVIRLQQGSSPSFMRPFHMSKHEEEECMKQVQDALGKGFRAKLFSVWCSIAFCIKNGWELENVH